jgi:hypothetical protein
MSMLIKMHRGHPQTFHGFYTTLSPPIKFILITTKGFLSFNVLGLLGFSKVKVGIQDH